MGAAGLGCRGVAVEMDGALVAAWLREAARRLHEQRDFLTQLDAAIGDADHGINMDRGFGLAVERVDERDGRPPGELLELAGTTLVLAVGGAAGPLYGSALRHMGRSLGDAPTFDGEDLLRSLRSALEEIQRLGAATPGDKTMVDALAPALDGLERGLRAGEPLSRAVSRAREAADEGAEATTPMQARKGRASYLGPRSVGHQDPGATSTALLLGALEHAVGGGR
jgi:dihydroxyacetone kinase-like protein